MPRNRNNAMGAMFDVKPVDSAGAVDVSKIERITPQINLRVRKKPASRLPPDAWSRDVRLAVRKTAQVSFSPIKIPEKSQINNDLHQLLNARGNWQAVLADLGVTLENPNRGKPRYRPGAANKENSMDELHKRLLRELRQPMEAIADPIEVEPAIPPAEISAEMPPPILVGYPEAIEQRAIEEWYHAAQPTAERFYEGVFAKIKNWSQQPASGKSIRNLLISFLLVGALTFGFQSILNFKNRIINDGSTAVHNLENAKASLEKFDFESASENFLAAYDEFTKAGDSLNFMGSSISSFLSELPGGGQLKSAQNLISVGQLIANAGQSMSDAVGTVAKTGVILNPSTSSNVFLSEIMAPLREALTVSGENLEEVSVLLASVEASVIPSEKQEIFLQFKSQLPEFEKLVSRGIEFANFFERLIGNRGEKKYLLLFQNHSELRPTGGFAGSYGVLTFDNGRLTDFFVDDIYNIDGQLKELIVPPLELQHITPTWAMRDVSWFIDFPTSAKKVLDFYKKESGRDLDGIITLSPDNIAEILKVVGPIHMPEYNLTLNSDNFLPEVQREVEYGENKKINKPKKIITDMTPILLQKLYSADKTAWLNVINVLVAGLERKEVLMYFKDQKLQAFSQEQGFSGEVKQTDTDYLMATFSNVKGSKTDAVTDTSLKLDTKLAENALRHKVTITRQHNGGKSEYGFYNRQNSSYVRILVPKGARLISVSGNANPGFKPLIDYPKTEFSRDADLVRLEDGIRHDNGIFEYTESGKTGFGFWMMTDPGEIKTVELEYTLSMEYEQDTYELYVQKQPGLKLKGFSWDVATTDALEISGSNVDWYTSGSTFTYSNAMTKDLPLLLRFK
ncbi:MAG: DUF4012 domain-containing protein [Candidatus Yanofskybacteria bacterium]|nr:DUF4012 domain-containing protein [Candidatus Yanofskybacteria bacterium]